MSRALLMCQRPEQILQNLRNLSRRLHSTEDEDTMLDDLARGTVEMLSAENCVVAVCFSDGLVNCRYFKDGALLPVSWGTHEGVPSGRVVFAAQPLLSNDAQHDPQIDAARAIANGVQSVVYAQICDDRDEMIGYLEVQNRRGGGNFLPLDLDLLVTVALSAAHLFAKVKAFKKVAQAAAEMEQRVAERTAQLRETNEELGSFAYSVSHDLRAPLRAVQGFAQILLEGRDMPLDAERCGFLERIIAAARGMETLVWDLLAFSRVSRQELLTHSIDLGQVVQDAVQQLKLTEGDRFLIQVSPEQFPRVSGDHTVLVQVILNILSNAVKYVAPGVTPNVKIWGEKQGDTVCLAVQDNGIGIAPDDQERIFKVFERLHGVESYPGTGLGLAIARKAVTRLGGRIGVESRLGEGSRFWVEFPAEDAAEAAAREGVKR